jgi:hypothetical protein
MRSPDTLVRRSVLFAALVTGAACNGNGVADPDARRTDAGVHVIDGPDDAVDAPHGRRTRHAKSSRRLRALSATATPASAPTAG